MATADLNICGVKSIRFTNLNEITSGRSFIFRIHFYGKNKEIYPDSVIQSGATSGKILVNNISANVTANEAYNTSYGCTYPFVDSSGCWMNISGINDYLNIEFDKVIYPSAVGVFINFSSGNKNASFRIDITNDLGKKVTGNITTDTIWETGYTSTQYFGSTTKIGAIAKLKSPSTLVQRNGKYYYRKSE